MSNPFPLPDLNSVLQELSRAGSPSNRGVLETESQVTSQGSLTFTHVQAPVQTPTTSTPGEFMSPSQALSPSAVLLPAAVPNDAKKYKIWKVSDEENRCYRLIGQGSTFCINHYCKVNHKSVKHVHPLPGEVYVLKTSTTAFCQPSIKPNILQDTLFDKWVQESCTLTEWSERFHLVSLESKYPVNRPPSQKISFGDIETKQREMKLVAKFRTPAKKANIDNDQFFVDHPEYRVIIARPSSDLIDFSSDPQLSQMEDTFVHIGKALATVYYSQQKDHDTTVEGLLNFESEITKLREDLGYQPPDLDPHFSAPSSWLSIASIADEVKNVSDNHNTMNEKIISLEKDIEVATDLSSSQVTNGILANLSPIHAQINKLNEFMVDATRVLNKKIQAVTNLSSNQNSNQDQIDTSSRERILLERMAALEREIASLRSNSDATSIKFGQLGFRGNKDCDSWMEAHHPGGDFGLLVDFHLVMEHVHVQMTGQKLMSNLEKIYKMSLDSNNQALAISSFESRLPRFFTHESKSHIRKDESYFPAIKTWDDWDLPHDGYRDRLNLELHLFKTGHLETLEAELAPLSPYYNLCVLALTESVSWVDSMMKFVDDTFNEYSRSRYGPKKAWHITTRLAKALIEKIAQPRNSVQNSFRINNPSEVCRSITYASLRSLDLMMEISSMNFKNSPIITSELSKYLALNTNYETVEKLTTRFASLETDSTTLKKDVKNAVSAASTASNKYDSTVKPLLEDLKKRVRSLESRA